MRDASQRWVFGTLAALALTLVLMHLVGTGNRTYASEQQTVAVRGASEAYDFLAQEGIKGRIVVILDQRTRIVPRVWMPTLLDSLADKDVRAPVMTHNFTSSLVYAGIAREVYFVPPDGLWQTELTRGVNRADSIAEGNGVRTRFYGVPVHVTKAADMPVVAEKLVVYIAWPVSDRYDPVFLDRITDPRTADIVIRQVEE